MRVGEVRFILYVSDQAAARDFYRVLLDRDATLDVPGMTEFELTPGTILGLMPETGIARIISPPLPHPAESTTPRCEVYLDVDDVDMAYERALSLGARRVSAPMRRDWGHDVGYVADLDGHVVAFASGSLR